MKPALFFFHFTCSDVSSSGAISFPVNAATSSPEIFLTRRNGRVALRGVASLSAVQGVARLSRADG